MFPLK